MRLTKNTALMAAIGAPALTACSSKTDANQSNFEKTLTLYFDKKGELCFAIDQAPVDVPVAEAQAQKNLPFGRAKQMAALEAAGLAKGEDADVKVKNYMGKPIGVTSKVRRYSLTDAAKPYLKEREVRPSLFADQSPKKETDLCWGKESLDKVVKWEGTIKLGDYQESGVIYTYKLDNLATWAKTPEIQAAFPFVKTTLEGAGSNELKRGVTLTSEGWEPKGVD